MTTSLIDADSLLVLDVGTVTTRALLFDVVEGRYRFVAAGQAPTTAGAPFKDLREGVRMAIDQLQAISGRALVDEEDRLITPIAPNGAGVDGCAVTLSAGPPLKILAVGLLDDISLESARRLAANLNCGSLETLSLSDRRRLETRLDSLLRLRPDLVLAAGGTENGASASLLRLLEPVALAGRLTPETLRPELLFAGNSALHEPVKAALEGAGNVHFAPNLRPSLEVEQLEPAEAVLNTLVRRVRLRQLQGLRELDNWAGGNLLPTPAAFGRIIRFLSQSHDSNKGVLGVDVGASAVTLAAAFRGELATGVFARPGLEQFAPGSAAGAAFGELLRWLALEVSEDEVREYLANKALRPGTVPQTAEQAAIEAAAVRVSLQQAAARLRPRYPARLAAADGRLPAFEPLLAAGGGLTRLPGPAQAMLALLDGLQPVGATTIVLDPYQVTAALGVLAARNPVLSIQVLDSSAYLHLGTVIAPVADVRPGTPILRVRMAAEDGQETNLEVKQGALEVMPLATGRSARLQLQPLHRCDVGLGGPGRGGGLRVVGGALGVVIDARGRPLALPADPAHRRDLFKKWLWTLGG